jgi:hypothetical protein
MSQFPSNFGQYSPPGGHGTPQPAKTSGKAVASLILGLLSFCMSFLTGIPAVILGILALGDVSRGKGRVGGQGLAIAGLITGGIGTLLSCLMVPAMLLPAVQAAREAARRMESMNNMKQIGMGIHNFHDVRREMPVAGLEGAAEEPGRPRGLGLSWRVHILPYIEQNSLYDQFHLDEPWDSPHNKQLISQMPKVYQSPNFMSPEFKTVYLAVVGQDDAPNGQAAAFTRTKPSTIARLAVDGLSNTIMVVEADVDQAVIWTKPDDWELDMQNPKHGLGHLRPGVFMALFGDGSVRSIRNDISDEMLRRLLTCDDGQMVEIP